MQKSVGLRCEPSSEPLHNSAMWLSRRSSSSRSEATQCLLSFMTLEPRVESYQSLWALYASPPRNRFMVLRCSRSQIENCTERHNSQFTNPALSRFDARRYHAQRPPGTLTTRLVPSRNPARFPLMCSLFLSLAKPYTLHSEHYNLNFEPLTPNPTPYTLNLQPKT
jgi:hypothetical protein